MNHSRTPQKHLTISDRLYIEQALLRKDSFKAIANHLRKDPTTISKEIKKHLYYPPKSNQYSYKYCKACKRFKDCILKNVCGKNTCRNQCKLCRRTDTTKMCSGFLPLSCNINSKAPSSTSSVIASGMNFFTIKS